MSGTTTTGLDRALGAALGLALGDAIGTPALYHRQSRLAERQTLWEFSQHADAHGINKYALPFSMYDNEILRLSGTDDAEQFAVAARILLELGDAPTADELSAGWRREIVDVDDDLRLAVSERASVENLRRGVLAPHSGGDNPHSFDDSSVARAVAVGIRHAGAPDTAAAVAAHLAEITNSHDGVWAAQAMAIAVAQLIAGASLDAALDSARAVIPADSWLGRGMARSLSIVGTGSNVFSLVPELTEECSNTVYSYGNVAPETLPVAFAIALAAGGELFPALGAAALIPKQADSMPAMVGALCGALNGIGSIPDEWRSRLDILKGHCVPSTRGESLPDLAGRLHEAGVS